MRHSLDPDEVPEESRLYRVAFPELQRKPRIDWATVAAVILMALFLALAVLA